MRYTGGCHCGKVRFSAEMTLDTGITCNCSICFKRGTVLTFIPEDKFELISGKEHLTEYRFNTKKIAHYFCSTCGIAPFGAGVAPDGAPTRAINLRCLDEIDLKSLSIHEFDGRSR